MRRVSDNSSLSSDPASCIEPPEDLVSSSTSNIMLEPIKTLPTVRAYPNPFKDSVRFKVNIPVSTEGSLEVVNMLGQRVATVYSGKMEAGLNEFEVKIPSKQTATLFYVLRTGDKKLTGKLVQMDR